MQKKTLTIFTPAYNRAYTIGRTYESLCRQTSCDFCWLIVDDGSVDNTRELVEDWIKVGKISIRYIYQENQGMHGAHNTAYRNIDTELNICIDSDDYMPDDAVEKIVSFWRKNGSEKYAGIIGLDATNDGKVIGNNFPMDRRQQLFVAIMRICMAAEIKR
jgi:glycosyltransferase involved in cell wall biosynthesis